MFEIAESRAGGKAERYAELAVSARGLLAGESDAIANAANFTALLFHALDRLNWCGVYFLRGAELVVGPFQGKPACVRIALGRGVCGHAAATRTITRVDDVHAFADHIACDAASNSEIVLPLVDRAGNLLGVLDLDSPHFARFDADDERGLAELAVVLVDALERSVIA